MSSEGTKIQDESSSVCDNDFQQIYTLLDEIDAINENLSFSFSNLVREINSVIPPKITRHSHTPSYRK